VAGVGVIGFVAMQSHGAGDVRDPFVTDPIVCSWPGVRTNAIVRVTRAFRAHDL
jgi:hypothetical protein